MGLRTAAAARFDACQLGPGDRSFAAAAAAAAAVGRGGRPASGKTTVRL